MRERVGARWAAKFTPPPFTITASTCCKRAGKDFGVLDDKDLWIYLRKRIHELAS